MPPTEARTDGWKSRDPSFFSGGLSNRFEPTRHRKISKIFHLIHFLIERYHRQKKVSENFEASRLNLTLPEKFLGALKWDIFYRIVAPCLSRQPLKSRHNGRYSRISVKHDSSDAVCFYYYKLCRAPFPN